MVTVTPAPDLLAWTPMPDKKKERTKPLRLSARTADMISEVAEATGKHVHEVVDELVGASLPPWHKAVQPRLKRVRELAARISAEQAEARKSGG